MELDKRIKDITDIKSVTDGCHDWEFMTKKGYFANSIFDFKELKRLCAYGEYAGWREHNQCFLCKQAGDETYYSYFLPEDRLLPEEPEKKYRPYTMNEFKAEFKIGMVLTLRDRNAPDYVYQVMYLGNRQYDESDSDNNTIFLSQRFFSLRELFNIFEIVRDGDWQPFGIEE